VSKDNVAENGAPMRPLAWTMSAKLAALGLGAALVVGMAGSAQAARPYIFFSQGAYYVVPQQSYRMPRKKVRRHREPAAAEHAKKESAKPIKGPLTIAVSIGEQRVRVYDGVTPIAEAPVSTGMKGHPTPMGVFSIIQKNKWHRSNIYSGAPMPYMQRITWSGVAMHAGVLPGYPASHGCIRMPTEFAIRLWGMTKMGARVIVARRGVAPAEFAHARLALLKKKPADPPVAEPAKPLNQGAETAPGLAGKTASAATSMTDGASPAGAKAPDAAKREAQAPVSAEPPALPLVEFGPPKPLRPGPVAIFVSKKEGKLFVRKGFEPLFDMPVKFARPNEPLGTHVFTAIEFQEDGQALRWTALSLPPEAKAEPRDELRRVNGRLVRETRLAHHEEPATSAQEALDRIELPQAALDRLAELMSPGASLTVSDKGLGGETGQGTDFIVLSR
jgi:lipoprotein-anchoring transpeptidase ErfK/SrfK